MGIVPCNSSSLCCLGDNLLSVCFNNNLTFKIDFPLYHYNVFIAEIAACLPKICGFFPRVKIFSEKCVHITKVCRQFIFFLYSVEICGCNFFCQLHFCAKVNCHGHFYFGKKKSLLYVRMIFKALFFS